MSVTKKCLERNVAKCHVFEKTFFFINWYLVLVKRKKNMFLEIICWGVFCFLFGCWVGCWVDFFLVWLLGRKKSRKKLLGIKLLTLLFFFYRKVSYLVHFVNYFMHFVSYFMQFARYWLNDTFCVRYLLSLNNTLKEKLIMRYTY